jgi:hypothetical protein
MIWFILIVLILPVLAWCAWEAWRWGQAQRVYADPETPALTITPNHVAALRKLQFTWSTLIESGGPVVDPMAPYGSKNMAADLGPMIGTRDRVAIARFHREVSAVLVWALKHGELADGQYRLADLDNAGMERRLRRALAGLPQERIAAVLADMPRLQPDGHFRFTDRHRRLLRALRLEWPDAYLMQIVAGSGYPAPVINFKRPFGDMTAFEIDMAAILDLPRPSVDRIDPLLDRLYWEMWPALQTFVEHATIDAASVPTAGR